MQARLRETLVAHLEVIRGLEPLLPEVERLAAWGTAVPARGRSHPVDGQRRERG